MRSAGAALNLPAELVAYIGQEAMAGRTDPAVLTAADQAIAERVGAAVQGAMAEQLAASPSFNVRLPKIPGRDLEGVPNADEPLMREKLRQRLLRNPSGQEDLSGFLKGA